MDIEADSPGNGYPSTHLPKSTSNWLYDLQTTFPLHKYIDINCKTFFRTLPYIINKVYFWYSFIFLIFRTTATFMYASFIVENSRKPLRIFRTIPTEGWSEELQRFSNQIKSDCGGISGNKLFYVSRHMMFRFAGALIMYELVLFQFEEAEVNLNPISCSF